MGDEVLAFFLMAGAISAFLAFIVAWGRFTEWRERRAAERSHHPIKNKPVIMSHKMPEPPITASTPPVYIPAGGMHTAAPDMPSMPDIDAEKVDPWKPPPVSAYLNDNEFFVFLAMQKTASGYRLSANKIAQIIGGDRNTILRRVKELRDTAPPQYRDLDEDKRPAGLSISQNGHSMS